MTIDFKNKTISDFHGESLDKLMDILDRLEYQDIKDFVFTNIKPLDEIKIKLKEFYPPSVTYQLVK